MNSFGEAELQELALRAIVAQRCQRAYLHDLRGGLQAISTSVEVLTRVAGTTPLNTDLLAKSSHFFKRASAEHERTLGKSLDDICGTSEEVTTVELQGLVGEVERFLQNDALSKDINLNFAAAGAVSVVAKRSNVRLVVLSLLTQGIDQSIPGTSITLRVGASPRPTIEITGITGERQGLAVGLLLPVSQRLMALDGGSIEPTTNGGDSIGWTLRW
jgi:hypothetical protein